MPSPVTLDGLRKFFGINLSAKNSAFAHHAVDPASPEEGDVWFNTTAKVWKGYDGTSVEVFAFVP